MVTKPLYRDVLKTAWRTTWRHKHLLLWGLFVGLLGNAGEYQFLVTSFDRVGGTEVLPPLALRLLDVPPATPASATGLWRALTTDTFSAFVVLLLSLLLVASVIFLIWLTMVSVVALVRAGAAVSAGKAPAGVGQAVVEAQPFFGSVLVLYVFGRLLVWLLLTLLAFFGLLALNDFLVGFPVFLVAFAVLLPALFLVSFATRYAIMFAVLDRLPILEAIDRAIALTRRHWLVSVELAFFLFAVNLALSLLLAALVALVVVPILLAAFVVLGTGLAVGALSLFALGAGLFLLFLFSVGATLGAFQWTAWTHLFLKLKEPGSVSKIVRLVSRWVRNRSVRLARA
jgi:hypothetical protein